MLFIKSLYRKISARASRSHGLTAYGISNVISGTGLARVAQGGHAPPPVDRRVKKKKKKGKKRKMEREKGKCSPETIH